MQNENKNLKEREQEREKVTYPVLKSEEAYVYQEKEDYLTSNSGFLVKFFIIWQTFYASNIKIPPSRQKITLSNN